MCGLFCIFGRDINSQDKDLTSKSLKKLKHRGPDSSKILKFQNNCIFGHNRLKIIDPSNNANQPISNQRYSIIYNGMLYNYLELRKELVKFYKFKTYSDTEVILAAYTVWGNSAFKKFNGMFSIIIYDLKNNKITCARDQLGIKQLYYCIKKNKIYFSSEINPLLTIINNLPNDNIVFKYLKYDSYEAENETFFKNIQQVKPGEFLEIKKNLNINSYKYWNLFEVINSNDDNFESKSKSIEKLKKNLSSISKNLIDQILKLVFFYLQEQTQIYLENVWKKKII